MIVAITTWDLHLPACHSLKEKRGVIKPLTIGLRRTLNVSVAETGQRTAGLQGQPLISKSEWRFCFDVNIGRVGHGYKTYDSR